MKPVGVVLTNPGAKWLGSPLCALSEMSTHFCLLATPPLSISVNRALPCLEYVVCVSGDCALSGLSVNTHSASGLYYTVCIIASDTLWDQTGTLHSRTTSHSLTCIYLYIHESCLTLWDDLQVHLLV